MECNQRHIGLSIRIWLRVYRDQQKDIEKGKRKGVRWQSLFHVPPSLAPTRHAGSNSPGMLRMPLRSGLGRQVFLGNLCKSDRGAEASYMLTSWRQMLWVSALSESIPFKNSPNYTRSTVHGCFRICTVIDLKRVQRPFAHSPPPAKDKSLMAHDAGLN